MPLCWNAELDICIFEEVKDLVSLRDCLFVYACVAFGNGAFVEEFCALAQPVSNKTEAAKIQINIFFMF